MPTIHYADAELQAADGETVLQCLERLGIPVVSSCRTGVCQSCVLRATDDTKALLPPLCQTGLKTSRKKLGDFLSCQCRAVSGLRIEGGAKVARARICAVEPLAERVLRVRIALDEPFSFHAGQFIQLRRSDGVARPYSIANLPDEGELELHVSVLEGGVMSTWLQNSNGLPVEVVGPQGDCIYLGDADEPLVLAGTGTGLAPLLGVLRAALRAGHRAPIQLFFGASHRDGLYYFDELKKLAQAHEQLQLRGSVLHGAQPTEQVFGLPLDQLLLERTSDLRRARVYLCGNPELVQRLRKKLFLAGASLDMIHSDPFVPAA